MSYGARLTLINAVLTSLPMFMLSFFEIPKGVLKRLDFYRSRFFWQFDEHTGKYRLANGISCVDLRTKADWALKTWKSKIDACLANGYSSYKMRKGSGKSSSTINTYIRRPYPRWKPNQLTLHFGRA